MKINQVEELVGITKKNIRFYEEQGLICPDRDRNNGYREYNLDDVKKLNQIKLLRRLEVPIDEIRKIQTGEITLTDCLDRHISHFTYKQAQLDIMKEMCKKMIDAQTNLDNLDAEAYLDDMRRLEEGGASFMDVRKTDVRKVKRGPIIAASVCIGFMLAMMVLIGWMSITDEDTPFLFIAILMAIFVAVIVGTVVALKQRLKEIDGGELDEASKY
ncbi:MULTISPECIES: MerR family transcriptional regulator [Pseudobutyrivibrio]|uniref:DNA-binding transcriptional regulator, MerR family n=1 Tax=Pseudobutyrivibrio xylanivorans TaxID=185007 RepID=A0A1G5RU27_PSEXY|nr:MULTISPECIES: MerR family transcriptional regulator [Pseudobutyrivibrio]MDC7280712.1 MerR family transcriptional regulator [Butyrivibrio fibrisolvens]SCZ77594.1 DNA-binding transcriptional regulator, MerR family [Pseudobutyrivibrio xylanivorans]